MQRAIRVAAILAGLAACTQHSESGTAPAQGRVSGADPEPVVEPAPVPKSAMLGQTVELRIVERDKTDGGIEARVSIDGRRAALVADLDTPLAAAIDGNEHLKVELAPEPGTDADRSGGALEIGTVTHRVVAFDGWMLPADAISHGALVGVWRVPKAGREVWDGKSVRQPGIPQFAYDGKYVVVRLFTEKDALYKLETRWVAGKDGRDELQYRPPFGDWTTLAASVYEGRARRLMLAESDKNWPLERVRKAADGDEDDRALVVDRPVHDYSKKPIDPR